MGIADRARKKMPAQGDYLSKDDLIRNQDEPFGVASCVYDEKGGNYGPRWVLSLIPWFEDQDDPKGLLTFDANPTRNPFFEDLQVQIEENDNEPIGPLTVVKGRSAKGFRYYTLDDWTPDGPANGPAPTDTPAPATARPARPAASDSAQQPTEVDPASIPDNPPARKRGRPRKDSATTPSTARTESATSEPVKATQETQVAQQVTPTMGKVECPDCHQIVEGRILPDDKGNKFIIHAFCPKLNRATVVPYVEA